MEHLEAELDEILNTVDLSHSDQSLAFYIDIMQSLGLEPKGFDQEESALLLKSQKEALSMNEQDELNRILKKSKLEMELLEAKAKAYLFQCNRGELRPTVNIH